MKNPNDPMGIEPTTFLLVAQCHNGMFHIKVFIFISFFLLVFLSYFPTLFLFRMFFFLCNSFSFYYAVSAA